jgi:hypothetical protein
LESNGSSPLIIRRFGTAGALHQNSNALCAGRKVAQTPGQLPGLVQTALIQKVPQCAHLLIKAVKLDRHASDFILIFCRHGFLAKPPKGPQSCASSPEDRSHGVGPGPGAIPAVWTYRRLQVPQMASRKPCLLDAPHADYAKPPVTKSTFQTLKMFDQ